MPQFLSFFKDIPIGERYSADFFNYIAFAKAAFTGTNAYFDSEPFLYEYFGVALDSSLKALRLPYPPNIILLIGALYPIELFFGVKTAIVSTFVFNFAFAAISSYILMKLSGKNYYLILALLLTSSFGVVAMLIGQLTFIFGLIITLFLYLFLKDKKVIAGIILSFLFIKPSIAFLFGIFALFHIRLLLGLIIGAIGSSLLSIMLCGAGIYKSFLESFILNSEKSFWIFCEKSYALPASLANIFGSEARFIFPAYFAFITLTAILFIYVYKKNSFLTYESKIGLLILMNFLTPPYSIIYDLALCIPGIVILSKQFHNEKLFWLLSFLFLYTSYSIDFIKYSGGLIFLLALVLYLISFKEKTGEQTCK